MTGRAKVLVGCAAALLVPVPLAAQSLLSSGGLGFPMHAVDARSRALGSAGLGLFGPAVLPTDPAASADLLVPEVTFTSQYSWVTLDGPANPGASGARFPVIGAAYPVPGLGVATLTFGGVLDQRWQVELRRDVDVGGETVPVTDTFVSDGGVSAVRIGFARRVAPSLAVGVSAGRYTGGVRRTFARNFDSLAVGVQIPSFVAGGFWSYRGPTVSVGAVMDIGEYFRAASTITWSGNLKAYPSNDTDGSAADFQVPTEYRLGASGALTPTVNLVAGLSYSDWTGVGGAELGGSSALEFGVGLELEDVGLAGRRFPVRLGYRRTELPFRFDGEDPVESVWTGGIGMNLANLTQGGDIPAARIDIGLESGDRSAGSLSESFWRATVTVRVAGN